MNVKHTLPAIFISALLLTLLFYKQGIGLNLLLFDILLLVWLFVTQQIDLKQQNVLISFIGFISSSVFTVVSYTIYGYCIHFLALFIFIGVLNYDKVRSLFSAFAMATAALPNAVISFSNRITGTTVKGRKVGSSIYRIRIFLIPLVIIFIFLAIYSNANDKFGDGVSVITASMESGWESLFANISPGLIFTYLLCLLISIFLLIRVRNAYFFNLDNKAKEQLQRIRKKNLFNFSFFGLKNEYKAAIFLLFTLNIILLILNGLDVYFVWFNFSWDGDSLKQFVHEGTWLLILSILISIAIVLYFFRGNLNFYTKNAFLKKLSYIWIIQNGVLVISVAIRNFWYIEYYALAYKRIGVILFLLLTLYGLYSVYTKIKVKKTAFYLFRTNALALYLILIISGLVNWDGVIARYNFAKADQSFTHYSYLSHFSDKALPHLDVSLDRIREIEKFKQTKFSFEKDMSSAEFYETIQKSKAAFKEKWEAKNWLAWNLAEYRAYKKLF